MRTLGAYPMSALPYILLRRPTEADAIARTLSAEIKSSVDDAVSGAAEAIRHWDRLSAIGRIPAAPPNLMTTLIERVVFRSKPGIGSCLYHLAYVITERQEAITPSRAGLLTASLLPWHHA